MYPPCTIDTRNHVTPTQFVPTLELCMKIWCLPSPLFLVKTWYLVMHRKNNWLRILITLSKFLFYASNDIKMTMDNSFSRKNFDEWHEFAYRDSECPINIDIHVNQENVQVARQVFFYNICKVLTRYSRMHVML